MAKRLTEEMVISRTKISDLGKIKRLNCWGSELVDVSLLRKMPSVEVLSLSINKINSLADFQFCKRLEELYMRQNDIRDLNQVVYLQNLPNLKNLWLAENPCAATDGYRLAVLRALPQLQKLDNVQVSPDELREAQKKGRNLIHPDDQDSEEEYEQYQQPPPQQQQHEYSEREYSPVQRSPPRQETDYECEESEEVYTREEPAVSEESREYSPPRQASPPRRSAEPVARRSYSPEYVEKRRSSYDHEQESPKQYYDKSNNTTASEDSQQIYSQSVQSQQQQQQTTQIVTASATICEPHFRELKIVNSQSTSCIKEYANGERYVVQPQYRHQEIGDNHNYEKRAYSCPASAHRPPFTRRPVTRNSNILSAVLCLVKELDYPSLEVVEMAVRCRMDELDE